MGILNYPHLAYKLNTNQINWKDNILIWTKSLIAGIDLLWTRIYRANVSHHVRDHSVLAALGMAIIHHYPRDIVMNRVQLFGCKCHLVHDLIALWSFRTWVDYVPVHSIFISANLALSCPIKSVFFDTNEKWKALRVVIKLSKCACFY